MLNQTAPRPKTVLPIRSIGAGGIVEVGHFPAYRSAGFPVEYVYDLDPVRGAEMASRVGATPVTSLHALASLPSEGCIFDLAVPGSQILDTLRQLPPKSYVLIQKPLGESLAMAEQIVQLCEDRDLKAAVNFQLRWCPYMLGLEDLIAKGMIGDPHDLEFRINVHTPWSQWGFLELAPRMEMVYHSIHYLDFIRHLWGEPSSIQALSIPGPSAPKLESTRSTVVLAYPGDRRASVHTFHHHTAPPGHEASMLKIEGTGGCAVVQMGLNLNYPQGGPDRLAFWRQGDAAWTEVPCEGTWIPDAFIGPMAAMMIWAESGTPPVTHVDDALKTMRLIDRAYRASDQARASTHLD